MKRTVVVLLVTLSLLLVQVPRKVEAQVQAVVAFCWLDTSVVTLQATATGWTWSLICAFNNPNTGAKDTVTGITADTLNADTLNQVGVKLANAAKASGQNHGFTVSAVLLPQSVMVVPN